MDAWIAPLINLGVSLLLMLASHASDMKTSAPSQPNAVERQTADAGSTGTAPIAVAAEEIIKP